MNHEDLHGFQRCEEDENVTNRRKRHRNNEISGIQNIMRQVVDAIQTFQSDISHNSPIKIYGEGTLTYEVV